MQRAQMVMALAETVILHGEIKGFGQGLKQHHARLSAGLRQSSLGFASRAWAALTSACAAGQAFNAT